MNNSRLLRLAVLVPVVVPTLVGAAPIPADSSITGVTVYVDRAIVTREAAVDLPAGAQEVVFAGLPDSLDPDLLQVSGTGEAEAAILDVRAEAVQLELAANPRLAALLEQARTLAAELRRVTDRATVVQQKRDYLERIKTATVTPPTAEGAGLPRLAEWQAFVGFYAEGLGAALAEAQELDREREGVQAKLAAVQREIKELQAPGQRTVKNVVVRLDVAAAGAMRLRLAYTVRGASWTPTYDVRVTSATRAIALGYAAMVRQSTGEDWRQARLVLSTARPALGGSAPELRTWFLREARPAPMAAMADSIVLAPFEASPDAPRPRMERSLAAAQATPEVGLTSATFTIAHPADIPSDNAPHKVAIATHPLEGELSRLAAPKLAELVFLRAAATNTSEFPLMAGPVNLYLDGTYVARSQLATVMPGAKFDLDLGIDDGFSVERKLVNRLTENTGLVTRRQRITYDVLITVKNNRTTAERIVVKDQVPVSQNEKITVTLLAPPAREVRRDEDGTLAWTLELAPGESRELGLKIAVEFPSDMAVDGLE